MAPALEAHQAQEDWNNHAIKEVKEKGDDAMGYLQYFAAKTMAERAGWDFVQEHKAAIEWDLATLLPVYVSIAAQRQGAQLTVSSGVRSISPRGAYSAILGNKLWTAHIHTY